MKNSMSEAIKQIRGKNVDVAIIIGGHGEPDGDEAMGAEESAAEEASEEQEKELGLAPDAERLEGTIADGKVNNEPNKIQDLGVVLESDPQAAASIGPLSKRAMAMKKGK